MENKRDRLIALLLTLLIGAAMLTFLVLTVVGPASLLPPKPGEAEDAEVFFADIDYTELTAEPTPEVDGEVASAAAAALSGMDMTEQGGEDSAPDLVAVPEPKPQGEQVARPEKPKPAAPTREQIEAEARAKVNNRFGAATNLKTSSDAQSAGQAAKGNAATGNNADASGLGLSGRQRKNEPDPGIKNATGWVKVRVTVNAKGVVTDAIMLSTSGFGAREAEVRNACLAASRKLRYSEDESKPTQKGTITWTIK